MRGFLGAALMASLVASQACAHGGGGGGHGGGSHYVYIPLYFGEISRDAIVPPPQIGDYSKIHSVAIISAIGQTLTLGRDATFAGNSSISIADWNFDHGVEETVSRDLATRFTVKPIAHDSAALAAIPNDHHDASSDKALQAYILALADRSVDAFVVVRPDAETGTPLTPGLSLDATLGGGRPVEVADFEIDVVDAQSGATLAHAFSRAVERQGMGPQFAAFWGSPDVRVMPNDVPTNAQRIQLKRDFERNLSLALRETLRSLDLGIKLPEIGARTITPLAADENPAFKTPKVMVVSALGDRVEVDYPGTLFGKRKDQIFQVAGWNLDAAFEKRALDSLDKHFTPVTVAVDRAKLAGLVLGDPNATQDPVPGITPGAPGVDLYVVLAKVQSKANDNTTGLTVRGDSGGDFGSIFSQYAILLVEPKNGRITAAVPGTTSPKFPSALPLEAIRETNVPNPGAAGFEPAQAEDARTLLTQAMGDSIEETLLRLHMTGKKIETGGGDIAVAVDDGGSQTASK